MSKAGAISTHYKLSPATLQARLLFLKAAVQMLFEPRDTYTFSSKSHPEYMPLVLPGSTIKDVLSCARIGVFHLICGQTIVKNGRVLLPFDSEKERTT